MVQYVLDHNGGMDTERTKSQLQRIHETSGNTSFTTPSHGLRKTTAVFGLLKGVHSAPMYEQLEAASEGVVDFKLDETTDPAQNLLRIRSFRNGGYDGRWHKLNVAKNFEVSLVN